jgi:sortase A
MARRLIRAAGAFLATAGLLGLLWVALVWRWQDPVTALLAKRAQSHLAAEYDRRLESLPNPRAQHEALATRVESLRHEARAYRESLLPGEPVGRLRVPRLGLNMMIVEGTDPQSLKKGPGRDPRTFMPGEGQLVYIAGHRTTYLAPFSHIDRLRRGDPISISLPYATFEYRVVRHTIVKATAIGVLRSPGREVLALQACHPRFFATHRYLVYASPVRVTPRVGRAFTPHT